MKSDYVIVFLMKKIEVLIKHMLDSIFDSSPLMLFNSISYFVFVLIFNVYFYSVSPTKYFEFIKTNFNFFLNFNYIHINVDTF